MPPDDDMSYFGLDTFLFLNLKPTKSNEIWKVNFQAKWC